MATKLHFLKGIVEAHVGGFIRGMGRARAATKTLRKEWAGAAGAMATAAGRIGLAVGALGVVVARTFAKFELTMVRVKAVTNATQTQFSQLQREAKRLGATTQFTAVQVAEAMEKMGLAGLKTHEIIAALPGALQLAAAAQVDVGTAADIAAKTMRAFQFSARDLARINDTLVATFTKANTDLPQLAEAMKMVGPVSQGLGVDLETTAAAIGKLSDAGFQGTMAGTSLRNILMRLGGAVPAVQKKLKAMGVDALDGAGKMRPLFTVIEEIKATGITTGEVLELFGARGGPQMAALMAVGADGLREFRDELVAARGIAHRLEQEQLKTLTGQFNLLRSAIEGIFIDSGQKLRPELRQLIQTTTEWMAANRDEIIQGMTDAIGGLVRILQNLISWVRTNRKALFSLWQTFSKVVAVIGNLLASYPQLVAWFAVWNVAKILGITSALGKLAGAIRATAAAMLGGSAAGAAGGAAGAGAGAGAAGGFAGAARFAAAGIIAFKVAVAAALAVGVLELARRIGLLKENFWDLGKAASSVAEQEALSDKISNRFVQDTRKRGVLAGTERDSEIKKKIENEKEALERAKAFKAAQQKVIDQNTVTRDDGSTFVKKGKSNMVAVAKRELASGRPDERIQEISKVILKLEQELERRAKERGEALRRRIERDGLFGDKKRAREEAQRRAAQAAARAQAIGENQARITEATEQGRIAQLDERAPGFQTLLENLQPGVTAGQAGRFVQSLGGSRKLASSFAGEFGKLTPEQVNDPAIIEPMLFKLAQLLEREKELTREKEKQAENEKRRLEAMPAILKDVGDRFRAVFAEAFKHLDQNQIDRFSRDFRKLEHEFKKGTLSSAQFAEETRKLNQSMQGAAAAARAEAAEKVREAKIRILTQGIGRDRRGKLTEQGRADLQLLMGERMRAFEQMQEQRLNGAWERITSFGNGMADATQRLQSFGPAVGQATDRLGGLGQKSMVKDPAAAFQKLGQFMQTPQFAMGSLRNNLQMEMQRASILKGKSGRKYQQSLARIAGMRRQLQAMSQPAAPLFAGVSTMPGNVVVDPGMQTQQGGGVVINQTLPNVSHVNPEQARQLAAIIGVELQRRGGGQFT